METYITSLFKEKTSNVDPGTSTDLANSLDLLSSGIYTEEERFIFELLQNAVDAFSNNAELNIRILVEDEYIIFMHNGASFSKRDIEGICSVGNGNKTNDIKKIGYKGIGFKSVFMHSDEVSVKSDNVIFEFNKYFDWKQFFKERKISESGRDYKMPWQIIPILRNNMPVDIDTEGYNVVTFLKVANSASIEKKIIKLFSDSQFLLFLRHDNIQINFTSREKFEYSISKTSSEFVKLGSFESQQKVNLYVNDVKESEWLVYKNDEVAVPTNLRTEIKTDSKTPQKLQDSKSFDVSFAIKLGKDGRFERVKDAVLYTYLPTSCKVNIPFLVNANFITDAGRQQLNVDAVWNQMVIASLPRLFINWISTLSSDYDNYYEVLPVKEIGIKTLSDIFKTHLGKALDDIAFIPSMYGNQKLKISETLIDQIGLRCALSTDRFNNVLSKQFGRIYTNSSLVNEKALEYLSPLGIKIINLSSFSNFIENIKSYIEGYSAEECVNFCLWLSVKKQGDNQIIPTEDLSYVPFLLDEKQSLAAPHDLFFPSDYRDDNEVAEDVKVLSPELYELIKSKNLENWISELGVTEMSHTSVIKNVLCKEGYITEENAISVLQFIFDVNKTENVFDKISSYVLDNIRILTSKNKLESPKNLYLTHDYGTSVYIDFPCDIDVFVSDRYIRPNDDPLEWAVFFKKLDVSSEIKLKKIIYENGSTIWSRFLTYINFGEKHEFNHSNWNGQDYYMHARYIGVKSSPFISLTNMTVDLSHFVWERILGETVYFSRDDDYIFGVTGWREYPIYAYLRDKSYEHNYLGENFLPWALKNYPLFPGSDGQLHRVQDLLENTALNVELFGKYLPVLDLDVNIDSSWNEYLPFKKHVTLPEYLEVLNKISIDENVIDEEGNKERISRIYQTIADNFDFVESSNDYQTLATWGKNHTILSVDKTFESPSSLNLVSDDLGKIDIDRQVYCGKHWQKRSNRNVLFMKCLGVTFIDSYTPSFEGEDINVSFIEKVSQKAPFITALSVGPDVNQTSYEEAYSKIYDKIRLLQFVCHDTIKLSFGSQQIEKRTYIDRENNKFHYVGKLNIATLELMHIDLAKYFDISASKASLLAILQMDDLVDIKDYLEQKGYDLSFINIDTEVDDIGTSNIVTIGGTVYGGLDRERRIQASEEARKAVMKRLLEEGYHFENGIGQQAVIEGVTKNGITYPLVVISHRTTNKIQITASEWLALREPNSMLWIYFGNGVAKPVNLGELIRKQDKLTLSFETENLASDERLTQFATVLQYFTDLHFDIDSLAPQDVAEKMGKYLFNYNSGKTIETITIDDSDENL